MIIATQRASGPTGQRAGDSTSSDGLATGVSCASAGSVADQADHRQHPVEVAQAAVERQFAQEQHPRNVGHDLLGGQEHADGGRYTITHHYLTGACRAVPKAAA